MRGWTLRAPRRSCSPARTARGRLQRRRRNEKARLLPVLAVGCATAQAARDAGFRSVTAADGDVGALAALATARLDPDSGRLVHVAGRVSTGDLAPRLRATGFEAERVPIYDAVASRAFSAPARHALESQALAGAAFYSPRTARLFAKLARESGLDSTARDTHRVLPEPSGGRSGSISSLETRLRGRRAATGCAGRVRRERARAGAREPASSNGEQEIVPASKRPRQA